MVGTRGNAYACALACACAFACACVDERRDPVPPLAVPTDSFWMIQAMAEARSREEPPPMRPASISLGNVGDTPLTGGVMRDTPPPAPIETRVSSANE